MIVRPYEASDREAVLRLWRDGGLVVPQNDPEQDLERKSGYQPELLFVGTEAELVVATVMAGYEGHRGWINYLAVDPTLRLKGLGRQIMEYAERELATLGCVKVNLQIRIGNSGVVGFYTALGYAVEERIQMGKKLQG